ncbi:hypothetical protein DUNSADRAFT_4028 [Dunaliella salina]|uniref:Encoded protein n=1 Tax=Dunaliella salina TaxID=3046 RepID=A0ABQ7FV04_DUNSA|nr:hypothetical protein DUNSADRAFT_4028 [Dunaliella salina]|eukprot:KAF5826232.1 hypothetical protein DUNSADRAFT_4028 [Dunaliella salina]
MGCLPCTERCGTDFEGPWHGGEDVEQPVWTGRQQGLLMQHPASLRSSWWSRALRVHFSLCPPQHASTLYLLPLSYTSDFGTTLSLVGSRSCFWVSAPEHAHGAAVIVGFCKALEAVLDSIAACMVCAART